MPILDLHHVALKTRDLSASERFYTESLGMEKVQRPDFDFPRRLGTDGSDHVSLDGRIRGSRPQW